MKNSEEILFECSVCANGVVLEKITQEPVVVTLNSKTKNKIFVIPPPDFAKMLNLKLSLKSGIFLDD